MRSFLGPSPDLTLGFASAKGKWNIYAVPSTELKQEGSSPLVGRGQAPPWHCIPMYSLLSEAKSLEKTVGEPQLGFLWLQQRESLGPQNLSSIPV